MTGQDEQVPAKQFLQRLSGRAPHETHISAVFVGENTVWKRKKAVKLSFLDFTTLAAREHFIRRELALNQPAAPGLYRDVVPILRRPDGTLALDGPGTPIDWVLRMARVPAENFFDRIAAEGRLTPILLDGLADAVAAYHQALPPLAKPPNSVAALRRAVEGNARAAIAAGLPDIGAWETEALETLAALAPCLTARADHVRRAHGDLHLGNLCLWQGRPVPFDALEFDEDLATTDLGYDLAFLLMDLDQLVGRASANRVMNRYVDRTGDAGLVGPLRLFLSLRAMIRAYVEAATGRPEPAHAYLRAAKNYLAPVPARLIAIGGLPGSGKSTLARALAPGIGAAPGALILRSDTIRKRQHGVAPEQRLGEAAYSQAATDAVNRELVALATAAAAAGQAVIGDATFLDPEQRRRIAGAAPDFAGFWLEAPRATLAERVAARTGDASDATPAVLQRMDDPGPGDWQPVDAADLSEAARRIKALLSVQPGHASC